MVKGIQVGGRCRYDAGQQRCYSSIGDQVDPTCIATTGFKGNKSCRRNPNVPIYNVAGPSKKAFQAATKRMSALKAKENEEIEKYFEDPIFHQKFEQMGGTCGIRHSKLGESTDQFGGYWSQDGNDLPSAADSEIGEELSSEQLGGGCTFKDYSGVCYANASNEFAPECDRSTGPKGYPSCKTKKGLVQGPRSFGPIRARGPMSEETKAKIKATKARNAAMRAK